MSTSQKQQQQQLQDHNKPKPSSSTASYQAKALQRKQSAASSSSINQLPKKIMMNLKDPTTATTKCNSTNEAAIEAPPSAQSGPQQQVNRAKLEANLHSAANEGKVELVRLLLRCGVNVNAQDEQLGNTALHLAAWNGFSETVQVLCKHRANTSIKNKALFTPLHLACQQGHNQSARLLLMASAKTEAKNSYGDTPLHTAARYGHAGVARILLSAKANPNQVNKNHDTPLHIAAAMGRRKLTKIFMQNPAIEPAIKNKQNETPMDIALRKDLIDIQELIANPPPIKASKSAIKNDVAYHQQEDLYLEPHTGHLRPPRKHRTHHRHQHHRSHQLISLDHEQLHHHRNDLRVSGESVISGASSQRKLCSTKRSMTRPVKSPTTDKIVDQINALELELESSSSKPIGRLASQSSTAQLHHEQRRLRSKTISGGVNLLVAPSRDAQANQLGGKKKSQSPTGSLRSSLSKSKGRLVVSRRNSRSLQVIKRPNLGTCVGKLSLLKLRNMVQKRAERVQASDDRQGDEPDGPGDKLTKESSKCGAARPSLGRRQERLERLKEDQQAEELAQVRLAPNGTQLMATKPLAPLSDDTQLYAIPKKSSKPKQQQQVASQQQAKDELSAPERAPSGGPALTSDGDAHSSSSSTGNGDCNSSASFGRAANLPKTPPLSTSTHIASSSDECIESLNTICGGGGANSRPSNNHDVYGQQPGYSVIRERTTDDAICLCSDHGRDNAATSEETEQQVAATARGSRSEKSRAEEARIADAAGSKKLRQLFHLDSRPVNDAIQPKPSPPISAIAGGYYAYSPVVQAATEQARPNGKLAATAASQPKTTKSWLMSKLSLTSSNHAKNAEQAKSTAPPKPESVQQLAPAREPEVIDSASVSKLNEDTVISKPDDQNQIRPKSTMSTTSADLIAAQKSLAAAAAAKVKRDRMIGKLANGGGYMNGRASLSDDDDQDDVAASKESVLTVKTSGAPFWQLGHHHQPLVVANMSQVESKYKHNGDGQNSVGMSDSSPSNNGADSDNSIHAGSASMDVPASSEMPASASGEPQSHSALGILSRLLLNNKRISTAGKLQDALTASGHQQSSTTSGSLSSSSLSSPASTSTGDSQQRSSLDQLAQSRSRCPIVLTRSNELSEGDKSELELPPRLPAKGVLKSHSSMMARQQQQGMNLNQVVMSQVDSQQQAMNGLPRVASYSQISSSYLQQQQAQLCNYHALNGHQANQSNAYNQYSSLLSNYAPHQMHHQSHHDLTLPAAATNYEYYLESSGHQQHYNYHHRQNFARDDSVYIPYANSSIIRQQQHPARDPYNPPATHSGLAQRPKSSLDNPSQHHFFAQSINGRNKLSANYPNHFLSSESGPLQAKQQAYYPQHLFEQHHLDTSGGYLQENFIYASDANTKTALASDLTVLPPGSEQQLATNGKQPYKSLIHVNLSPNVAGLTNGHLSSADKSLASGKQQSCLASKTKVLINGQGSQQQITANESSSTSTSTLKQAAESEELNNGSTML